MKITIGSDHAGFELKRLLIDHLRQCGNELTDVGTDSTEPVDYPDYAEAVGLSLLQGKSERGILICGSGVGASVAANKIPGIRAGLCHDLLLAEISRANNDSNVLVIGAMIVAPRLAERITDIWLGTAFTGGRHVRRLEQITALERGELSFPD